MLKTATIIFSDIKTSFCKMAERELTLLIESSNTTQNAIKGMNELTAEPKDSKAARYSYEMPFCYPFLHTHTLPLGAGTTRYTAV